jgi:hypothetical protein
MSKIKIKQSMNEQTMLPQKNLADVLNILADMQAENIIKDFAIGGAVAAILHYEPISTVDLDIFFFFSEKQSGLIPSLDKIYDYAKGKGFEFDSEFINIYGWLVQFVESSHNQLWIEAIENADTFETAGIKFSVIGKEHLTAMWILAGRPKDYKKIEMFIEADFLNFDKLTDILTRYNLLEKWKKESWRFMSDE